MIKSKGGLNYGFAYFDGLRDQQDALAKLHLTQFGKSAVKTNSSFKKERSREPIRARPKLPPVEKESVIEKATKFLAYSRFLTPKPQESSRLLFVISLGTSTPTSISMP